MLPETESTPVLAHPGNSKLGPTAWTFSLPAVATCPGRSDACTLACYATKGRFRTHVIQRSLERRREWSRDGRFAARVMREVARFGIRSLRVHVSGDFDDPDYARAWLQVMRGCPATRFWFYTRSWRDRETGGHAPEFTRVFKEMAALENVAAWYSADRETGPPPARARARRVRLAYMARDAADRPAFPCDLVFLVRKPKAPTRHVAGVEVCPFEDGVRRNSRPTCDRCRKCIDRLHTLRSDWTKPEKEATPR